MEVFIEQTCEPNKKNVFDKQTKQYLKTVDFHLTYPYPYGYILDTLAPDGDELDCYIITKQTFEHSVVIECEPIGMVEFFENEQADHKIFVVPKGEIGEVTDEVKGKLLNFNSRYFEGQLSKDVKIGNFLDAKDAYEEIKKSQM